MEKIRYKFSLNRVFKEFLKIEVFTFWMIIGMCDQCGSVHSAWISVELIAAINFTEIFSKTVFSMVFIIAKVAK